MIVYHAYHKEKPVFYIGKTTKSLSHRRKQHENEAKHGKTNSVFHKALRKYGNDMFEYRVLSKCDTAEELNAEEIRWIALVKECGHRLYNITDGGDGNNGGRYWAEHEMSQEMRNKISNTLKEYYKTHPHPRKGKKTGKTWNKGLTKDTHTSIKKVAELKIGKPRSDETKRKLREANIGKKLQPHVIEILKEKFSGANNPSARPVICITTNEEFEYATLAANKYNIDLSGIIKCCKGKVKTVKGMSFQYKKSYPAGWEEYTP